MPKSEFVYVTYIKTTPDKLWNALTDPEVMKQWRFGTHAESDWSVGSSWKMITEAGQIIDTGEIAHVFDRFHTGDAARGSGLGLTIARELAERMRGRLDVRSRPGRTIFTLTLPFVSESPAREIARELAATGGST